MSDERPTPPPPSTLRGDDAYDETATFITDRAVTSAPPSAPATVAHLSQLEHQVKDLTAIVSELRGQLLTKAFASQGDVEALSRVVRDVTNHTHYETERARVEMRALKDAVRALDLRRTEFETHVGAVDQAQALEIATQKRATARLAVWKWVLGSLALVIGSHAVGWAERLLTHANAP